MCACVCVCVCVCKGDVEIPEVRAFVCVCVCVYVHVHMRISPYGVRMGGVKCVRACVCVCVCVCRVKEESGVRHAVSFSRCASQEQWRDSGKRTALSHENGGTAEKEWHNDSLSR